MSRSPHRLLGPLFVALAVLAAGASADPAEDLKSKDVKVRLAAVDALAESADAASAELLVDALKDKDWEVIEHAVAALAGKSGIEVKPLLSLTLKGPNRRIRLAAARSLDRLDRERAIEKLKGSLGSEEYGVRAAEALVEISRGADPAATRDAITKALKSQNPLVRAAGALGLGTFASDLRGGRLDKLMGDSDLRVVCAGIDGARLAPDVALIEPLLGRLGSSNQNDVVARRLVAAVVAQVATKPAGDESTLAATPILEAVGTAPNAEAASRLAHVIGALGKAPPEPAEGEEPANRLLGAGPALSALEPLLTSEWEPARAASANALAEIGSEDAWDRALQLAESDASARVRLLALRAAVGGRGVTHEPTFQAVCKQAIEDKDAGVREDALVALGEKGIEATTTLEQPIRKALADKKAANWGEAVVAAVSLGKTQNETGLPVLLDMAKAKDWRLRGGAIVGLGRIEMKPAVPVLISALKDKSRAVKRAAYEFLRRLPPKETKIPPKQGEWAAWWAKNEATYEWVDWAALARKNAQYGYATTPKDVYEGLDVVVLSSRGDHIEQLLEALEIEHRLTTAGQIQKAELHPFALFVANCTGEGCNAKDFDQLQWFVRVGGYLFSSCWALKHTVEGVWGDIIRKYPTRTGNVIGTVRSYPCKEDSVYLEGVFDGVTQPLYVLEGAFLIEVVDPEMCEVLIDSPEAANTWGCGNLCAWFRAGHGVILDSVNHFDLQGLTRPASEIKEIEQRMGYAMDHMGVTYEELREYDAEGIWKKKSKAMKLVRDKSAFRLISNFVKQKRRKDP